MRDHDSNTITITTDTLDLDESGFVYTIDDSSISTITTSLTDLGGPDLISMDDISITLNDPVEFEDRMPDVAKVEDMCNDYPALKQAYEKFKTIYAMVHQDWQGKQDNDEEYPF